MRTMLGRLRFRLEHRLGAARMSDYLDGELGQVLRRRLAHHLSECHECRELLVSLRQVLAVLQDAARVDDAREVAPPLAAAVLARLDEPA
jgi:predicted anti-sigma-YlaC factor YlaD